MSITSIIRNLSFASLLACQPISVQAQSPIANRVYAASKALSRKGQVVARYKDRQRHGVYYIYDSRLYFYDVMTDRTANITFCNSNYDKILNSWLSPEGTFIFIVIDRTSMVSNYLDGGQELWRFDSRTKRYSKIGQGYAVRRNHECIWIKRSTRCLNPSAPTSQRRWMGQDHYYDAFGKVIWAKEEYEIKR